VTIGIPSPPTGFEALLKRIKALEERIGFQETNNEGGGSGGDADTVDTFHAAAAPAASTLLALDASSEFPWSTIALNSMVYIEDLWQNQVAWALANNNNWQQDTQSTTVTVRRKSDVLILSDIAWNNSTAARINGQAHRWTLGGAAATGMSSGTGNIGSTLSTVEHHFVGEVFQDVAAGDHTLQLESQKTQVAWSGDTVNVFYRIAIIVVIPKD
jgi:hypothetical protein